MARAPPGAVLSAARRAAAPSPAPPARPSARPSLCICCVSADRRCRGHVPGTSSSCVTNVCADSLTPSESAAPSTPASQRSRLASARPRRPSPDPTPPAARPAPLLPARDETRIRIRMAPRSEAPTPPSSSFPPPTTTRPAVRAPPVPSPQRPPRMAPGRPTGGRERRPESMLLAGSMRRTLPRLPCRRSSRRRSG